MSSSKNVNVRRWVPKSARAHRSFALFPRGALVGGSAPLVLKKMFVGGAQGALKIDLVNAVNV